jgi:xanthine dehydrogenase YagS FAD-binding subunit
MTALSGVDAVAARVIEGGGELRAGGTDVTARQRSGLASGPFVDLRDVTGLRGITWHPDGSARIGAMTTIAEIAADARLGAAYPALTLTAGSLATPQLRSAGTLGGNLLQRNRCWYYRNPAVSCYQTGGDSCPARAGLNLYSTVIDLGPCVAPHPSTMAMALLAQDATVRVHGRGVMPVGDLYDGTDPTRDHQLGAGDVLVSIELPVPSAGERGAYRRAIARQEAEWPLVEVVTRLVITDGVITLAAVAAGGVARTPVRLGEVEAALVGQPPAEEVLAAAADRATAGCRPLRQTGYKVALLRGTTLEVLERASAD